MYNRVIVLQKNTTGNATEQNIGVPVDQVSCQAGYKYLVAAPVIDTLQVDTQLWTVSLSFFINYDK